MTAFIIICLIVGWVVLSAVFVMTASMMSARISRQEESPDRIPVLEIPTRTAYKQGQGAASQPHPSLNQIP
jgi:hypothetical protein